MRGQSAILHSDTKTLLAFRILPDWLLLGRRRCAQFWGLPLLHQQRNGFYAALFCIVIVGTWLRLRNLGADSIWTDEAASWLQSKGTLVELISLTAGDNYPPLHNLLLFAAMKISGADTEWILRLPSAMLGIANVVAVYWLGTLVGSRIAGIFAATILALSSQHIYFSQEARMYSLLALAATLYAASAFYFVKSPTNSRAALLGVCGLALVYSHPFGTLNWIAIAVGVSAHIVLTSGFPRHGLFRWIAANAAIAIIFLPWALLLQKRARVLAGWWFVRPPTVDGIVSLCLRLCGGTLASAALLASSVAGLRANFRVFGILLIWAVGPITMALMVTLITTHILGRPVHMFALRYYVGALPALAVLAGLGLAYLVTRPAWSGRIAAAALLAAVTIGSLTNPPAPRDDWRTVARYLDGHLQESDCVLLYPAFFVDPLRYYLRKPFCAILLQSPPKLDTQAIAADRVFGVFASDVISQNRGISLLQAEMGAFGRGVERLNLSNPAVVDDVGVRNITIIEYKRQR